MASDTRGKLVVQLVAPATFRAMELRQRTFAPETVDGWALELTSFHAEGRRRSELRPVLFVPGYGMNSFILSFHPKGTSFVHALCNAGFEVWTTNLRGQGRSRRLRRSAPGPSLRRLAQRDLATSVQTVLSHTRTQASRVDLIGCSLGGSLSYAYLALAERPHVGSLVAIGSPLRWIEVPGLLRTVFSSRTVAGALRVSGSRRMASIAFPFAKKFPQLLQLYANAANIDMEHVGTMVQTVEDPHPRTNRDIASWLKHGDMVLSGINVSEAMRQQTIPLLLVAANRDGIVPVPTALGAKELWGGSDVGVLRVGTPDSWYAHADIFVGREAPEIVFGPVGKWLEERS